MIKPATEIAKALVEAGKDVLCAANQDSNAVLHMEIRKLKQALTHAPALLKHLGGQDISTAPKDGTSVIVCNGYGTRAIAYYSAVTGEWHYSDSRDFEIVGVTHWMPLPNPPKAGEFMGIKIVENPAVPPDTMIMKNARGDVVVSKIKAGE